MAIRIMIYRKTLRWVDGTTCYNGNMSVDFGDINEIHSVYISQFLVNVYQANCLSIYLGKKGTFFPTKCSENICSTFFCETKQSHKEHHKNVINFQRNTPELLTQLVGGKYPLILCPTGHVTHSFLSCDTKSHCGMKEAQKHCVFYKSDDGMLVKPDTTAAETLPTGLSVTVEMFECHSEGETIPYTLVCDFRKDCDDNSDEIHCTHEKGMQFRCANGQDIIQKDVCDMKNDCVDGSDEKAETCLQNVMGWLKAFHRKPAPLYINVDSSGNVFEENMDVNNSECSDTHFLCPGKHVYCMPVFLRCNGIKDCLGGEDEVGCDDITCPGYYRCRSSDVCLHDNHLCDGWPQCPERDDELLCNATCPSGCHCQGLAFVCNKLFPASHYPDLRYLDATGSGTLPVNLTDNRYLVYLNLAECRLKSWSENKYQNLQKLDLSDNAISTFHITSLYMLPKLRFLHLKGNPLRLLEGSEGTSKIPLLITLDASHTHISSVTIRSLINLSHLKLLNFSFSKLNAIDEGGLSYIKSLTTIDLRGCNLQKYPQQLFRDLHKIRVIFVSNYQLCCKNVLPVDFNLENCFFFQDPLSSCQHLLRHTSHHIFLWIHGLVSISANLCGVIFMSCAFCSKQGRNAGHKILICNLKASNTLKGFYSVIMVSAHEMYRGRYAYFVKTWPTSLNCEVAGFLSFLSSEVSVFMIFFITLDRFIVIHFPLKEGCFEGKNAVLTCALAWMTGIVIVVVPLLPVSFFRNFYSQIESCIPLPFLYQSVQGRDYAFGVLIVLNFILYVLVAFGEMSIYRFIQLHPEIITCTTRGIMPGTRIARRFVTIVVVEIMCWLIISLVGLMDFCGYPVPRDIGVAVAVFALQINSSLNPILYAYSILQERRRKFKYDKMMKVLQACVRK